MNTQPAGRLALSPQRKLRLAERVQRAFDDTPLAADAFGPVRAVLAG